MDPLTTTDKLIIDGFLAAILLSMLGGGIVVIAFLVRAIEHDVKQRQQLQALLAQIEKLSTEWDAYKGYIHQTNKLTQLPPTVPKADSMKYPA